MFSLSTFCDCRHLHLGNMYVLAHGDTNSTWSTDDARSYDVRTAVSRNTAVLHPNGWTALRLKGDNPGTALFRKLSLHSKTSNENMTFRPISQLTISSLMSSDICTRSVYSYVHSLRGECLDRLSHSSTYADGDGIHDSSR